MANALEIASPEREGPAHPALAATNPLLLTALRDGRLDAEALAAAPAATRPYQLAQNDLVDELLDIEEAPEPWHLPPPAESKAARTATRVSFGVNVLLCAVKFFAFGLSQSYVVLASAVDSTLDLVSGAVLYFQAQCAAREDRPSVRAKYPTGLSRLEPVAVLVFSVLMASLSLQILVESMTALVEGLTKATPPRPAATPEVIAIIVLVIVVKAALHVWCARIAARGGTGLGPVEALADDHRNDVISNGWGLAALLVAAMGPSASWVADPIGAALISIMLIAAWAGTAKEQAVTLVGVAPPSSFYAKVAYMALKASPDLVGVDTLRAYSAGATTFNVELDIILPPEMTHRDAHDVGQALQDRLEADPAVARAFVHLDWEASHDIEHGGRPSVAKLVPRPDSPALEEAPLLSVKKGT